MGKNSIFGVYKKNFVVDCFWGKTWAGSTISHQNITFTQGFWLVKEFWCSGFFYMEKKNFFGLEKWKSKVNLCVLFIHQRIAGDVRFFQKIILAFWVNSLVLESTRFSRGYSSPRALCFFKLHLRCKSFTCLWHVAN